MVSLVLNRDDRVVLPAQTHQPLAAIVIGVILSFCACSILSSFIARRILDVKTWSRLPFINWVVFAIYGNSWIFVFVTTIINYGIGVDTSLGVCSAAILPFLFCYIMTKFQILVYVFLVEKTFTVWGGAKRRFESKIYLFNSFGILTMYAVMCTLNFVYREARMKNGQCIIGIGRPALIPFIAFDILVNVYLMVLLLISLRNIYSFKGLSPVSANTAGLRIVAMRTFIGALCTASSSIVNITVLMLFDGEPGWICLTCCNAEILFSALIIQWVTSGTQPGVLGSASTSPPAPSSSPSTASDNKSKNIAYHATPSPPPATPSRRRSQKLSISLPLKTTSTSQYEHIFGEDADLELEATTDVGSGNSSTTTQQHVRNTNNTNNVSVFDFSDDAEAESSNGRRSRKRGKQSSRRLYGYSSPTCSTTTSTGVSTSTGTAEHHHQQNRQPPPAPPPSSVTAAVAADLERLRRYRRQRYGSTATALLSTSTAIAGEEAEAETETEVMSMTPLAPRTQTLAPRRAPSRPYRISHLAFEGEDQDAPWDEFVGVDIDGDGHGGGGASESMDGSRIQDKDGDRIGGGGDGYSGWI
ncbi:hypothetical protein GGR54DRAFT_645920 [Hypoxylon sp. NC1633]|nr:hypothetical protein GGR54DRAFT_645920 [Hypoxylon sp. NC1633]